MKTVLCAALALVLSLVAASAGSLPGEHDRVWPLGRHVGSGVYVVAGNPGGSVDGFIAAARRIKRGGGGLIIDGPCASACTLAADLARPNVCVTRRAVLQFHKWYRRDRHGVVRRGDPSSEYSADIAGWVNSHGGFPGETVEDASTLDMSAAEAARFFPACG